MLSQNHKHLIYYIIKENLKKITGVPVLQLTPVYFIGFLVILCPVSFTLVLCHVLCHVECLALAILLVTVTTAALAKNLLFKLLEILCNFNPSKLTLSNRSKISIRSPESSDKEIHACETNPTRNTNKIHRELAERGMDFGSRCFCRVHSNHTRSKRSLEIQQLRERKKEYDLKTAISLVKETAKTKFVETLGANAILAVSLAVSRAGAAVLKVPLYKFFSYDQAFK
ncbi:hypothetical protein JHK87_018325 [Glycine soja]|nr:hypothetical protein JHK87_018325 [Glycine soja]